MFIIMINMPRTKPLGVSYETQSVNITKSQKDFLAEHSINVSQLIRNLLDEYIKKEKARGRILQ